MSYHVKTTLCHDNSIRYIVAVLAATPLCCLCRQGTKSDCIRKQQRVAMHKIVETLRAGLDCLSWTTVYLVFEATALVLLCTQELLLEVSRRPDLACVCTVSQSSCIVRTNDSIVWTTLDVSRRPDLACVCTVSQSSCIVRTNGSIVWTTLDVSRRPDLACVCTVSQSSCHKLLYCVASIHLFSAFTRAQTWPEDNCNQLTQFLHTPLVMNMQS